MLPMAGLCRGGSSHCSRGYRLSGLLSALSTVPSPSYGAWSLARSLLLRMTPSRVVPSGKYVFGRGALEFGAGPCVTLEGWL
jgi:hypothetical protein